MNYYAILLFILFSPWAWLGIACLLAVFVYASIRFSVTSAVSRMQIRGASGDPERLRGTLDYLKTMRLKHKPGFWFTILLLNGLALIIGLGLPLLCTYGIRC